MDRKPTGVREENEARIGGIDPRSARSPLSQAGGMTGFVTGLIRNHGRLLDADCPCTAIHHQTNACATT